MVAAGETTRRPPRAADACLTSVHGVDCGQARTRGARDAAHRVRADDAEFVERILSQTGRGRSLGTDRFLSKVETLLGRRVRPLPIGRPRKPKKRGMK